MLRRRLIALAEDTTAVHCGSCHHVGVGQGTEECRADDFPGQPLAWDEAAQSSVRSAACHEAELRGPALALVMGSKPTPAPQPMTRAGVLKALASDEQPVTDRPSTIPPTDPAPLPESARSALARAKELVASYPPPAELEDKLPDPAPPQGTNGTHSMRESER